MYALSLSMFASIHTLTKLSLFLVHQSVVRQAKHGVMNASKLKRAIGKDFSRFAGHPYKWWINWWECQCYKMSHPSCCPAHPAKYLCVYIVCVCLRVCVCVCFVIAGYRQQDAHDFLSECLNCINNGQTQSHNTPICSPLQLYITPQHQSFGQM